MALKNGVNYAKLIAEPVRVAIPPDYRGRVRSISDEYVFVTGDLQNDDVNLGFLEPGDLVLDGYVEHDNLGASTQFRLGDAGAGAIVADDDRYFVAFATTAAGKSRGLAATAVRFKNTSMARIPLVGRILGANPTNLAKVRTCLFVVGD